MSDPASTSPPDCLPSAPPRWLHLRLSVLMFLQFAVLGAFLPLFSLHLKEGLGFGPLLLAWIYATPALAMLVSPLAMGQFADRWFAAERCQAVCALLSGVLLWVLADLKEPVAVFTVSLAVWLVLQPAVALGTTISLTHLPAPEQQFGRVRLWGTLGWMVPGWLLLGWFSYHAASALADALRLASLLALTLSAYALTVPHTPPARRAATWLAPLAALQLLRGRAFAVYCACALGAWMTLPFTAQVTPLLLKAIGIPRAWLSPTLTIAQSMEIIALALLPMLILRLGVRGTMLLGLIAWTLALTILALGQPVWLVVASQTLNGLFICCFAVAGQVFVNRKARGDIRASAQALLAFTTGLGMLTGNVLVGCIRDLVDEAFPPTFAVGAAIALVLVLVFFAGFTDDATA